MRWAQLGRASDAPPLPGAAQVQLAHELMAELARLSPMTAPTFLGSRRIVAEWLAAGLPPGLVRQAIAREAGACKAGCQGRAISAPHHPVLRDPQLQRAAWLAARRPRRSTTRLGRAAR